MEFDKLNEKYILKSNYRRVGRICPVKYQDIFKFTWYIRQKLIEWIYCKSQDSLREKYFLKRAREKMCPIRIKIYYEVQVIFKI